MGWRSSAMESRIHAIELVDAGVPVTESARLSGVTRQCLHKWLRRREAEGIEGLKDRSRAPKKHPNAVTAVMRKRALRYKKKHPDEGPRKIHGYLRGKYPGQKVPAASTIGLILKEEGLCVERPTRRREPVTTSNQLTDGVEPNQVWCLDYKGEFAVGGELCYPFTVTDHFSRFAIVVRGHRGATVKDSVRALWRAFDTFGLPRVIRCDNGTPFASTKSPAGLTRLAVMLERLGIRRERIDPGKPSQNGRHERFHRSLKGATANPPAHSWQAQQKRFERYCKHYNETRPHEALNMNVPASVYQTSDRARPQNLPVIEHPKAQRVIPVYSSGEIGLKGKKLFLTSTLAGETIAVDEIEDDLFRCTYGSLYLGVYSLREERPVFHQAP